MAVRYDATGPGADDQGQSSGTMTLSWTHSPASFDNLAVLVGVVVGRAGSAAPTATYAGRTMDVLGTVDAEASKGSVRLFGIINPPVGPQTVVVSLALESATGMAANSVSYTGVGRFGGTATSTTEAVSIPTPVDGMSVIAAGGAASDFTTFDKTKRWEGDTGQVFVLWASAMGDDDTAGTTTYGYDSGSRECAVAVSLIPAMPFYQMF